MIVYLVTVIAERLPQEKPATTQTNVPPATQATSPAPGAQAPAVTKEEALRQFDQEIRSRIDVVHRIAVENNTLIDSMQVALKQPCSQSSMATYQRSLERLPELDARREKETDWFLTHASDPRIDDVKRLDPKLDSLLGKGSAEMRALAERGDGLVLRVQSVIGTCPQ